MKFLGILPLLWAFAVQADNLLIVVEKNVYPYVTNLQPYVAAVQADGHTVEVIQWDSWDPANNRIDTSSKKARKLAVEQIWPRVNAGVDAIFMLGELPVAASGISLSPDGHSGPTTQDGWRGIQNSEGCYFASHFYGSPGTFGTTFTDPTGWNDLQRAPISITLGRNNDIGDGRFDENTMPTGVRKLKAAVGWFGNFADSNGTDYAARGARISTYLKRNIALRNAPSRGAVYEFKDPETGDAAHANPEWLAAARRMFGTNVSVAAKDYLLGLKGTNLYSRDLPFKVGWFGSDWFGFIVTGSGATAVTKPFVQVAFLHLSFHQEVPSRVGNWMASIVAGNASNSPLACIKWSRGLNLSIEDMAAGQTIGHMVRTASQRASNWGVEFGFYGDPTLRIVPANTEPPPSPTPPSAPGGAAPSAVRLRWDPSTSDNITNYSVFRGQSSGAYTTNFNSGTAVELVAPTVIGDNFFAVTAQSSNGLSSDYSNEVHILVE